MFKVFLKGLVFGFGIVVSLIIAWFVSSNIDFSKTVSTSNTFEDVESWNSLSDNKKINKASALIILRYKQQEEGLMSAYIAEVHKKDSSIKVKGKVGDSRENSNFYSRGGMGRDRDGAVIFLTGSPARERGTRYLYDNRIAGAGDMPLNILLKKFTANTSIKSIEKENNEGKNNPSINSNKEFHELETDEQIKQASVIVLANYEKNDSGKTKVIIKEFLKKEAGTTIYYDIGDEHSPSSYFPKENTSYGDGMIIFFTGSPASMKMSWTYSGDRIRGLGDMPLKLLREKCKE